MRADRGGLYGAHRAFVRIGIDDKKTIWANFPL